MEARSCSYDILFHDNISLVLGGVEKENEVLDIIIFVERTEQVGNKAESIIMPLHKTKVSVYPEYHVQLWSSSLSVRIQ